MGIFRRVWRREKKFALKHYIFWHFFGPEKDYIVTRKIKVIAFFVSIFPKMAANI